MTGLPTRWLATGGAVVLAGVIGVALVLQHGGAACAAPPSTSSSGGKATFYDLGGGTGNCSFPGAPADDLFVALGPSQYAAGAACGSYLDVTGPKGKVRVKVIDSCPGCAPGHLDLSRTAFKKIANEVQGVVPIKYKAVVNPRVPGAMTVRLEDGASRFWFSAQIDNHGNRLTSVRVASGGGTFRTAKRAAHNYWIINGGAGSGPFKIKITDAYGHTATVTGIALRSGLQRTTARLAGGGAVAPKPPASKRSATPSLSPSASPTASPSASSSASASASVVAEDRLLESTSVPDGSAEVALAAGSAQSCAG